MSFSQMAAGFGSVFVEEEYTSLITWSATASKMVGGTPYTLGAIGIANALDAGKKAFLRQDQLHTNFPRVEICSIESLDFGPG